MLRRFLYLHEKALSGYLSTLEGGLSDEVIRHQATRGTKGGRVSVGTDMAGVGISMDRDRAEEATRTVRETSEQRFDRLMRVLDGDPDAYDFEEVLDLHDAFPRLAVGSFISVACDIEVPPLVRLLAQPDQMDDLVNLTDTLRSVAFLIGEDIDGLPSKQEASAYRKFFHAIKSDLVIVGEQDEGSPKIVGKLETEYVRDLPEGEACVVGKVTRRWMEGESHFLLALPGASLLSREERRKAQPSGDENTVRGPALALDVLAIYR